MTSRAEHQALWAVMSKYEDALREIPGVADVGIGFREQGGQLTTEPVIVVRVHRKVPPDSLPEDGRVPRSLDGIMIDVQEAHEIEQQHHTKLCGGLSIQNVHRKGSGTLGAIVTDLNTGHRVGLTNHHVLFGKVWRLPGIGRVRGGQIGDAVVEPGTGRHPEDTIGTVLRGNATADAALTSLNDSRAFEDFAISGMPGKWNGSSSAYIGQKLSKSGARTGLTHGIVDFVTRYQVRLRPDPDHPVRGNKISDHGDSGAVWVAVDDSITAVALHNVGIDAGRGHELAGAVPIATVEAAMKIAFR